MREVRAEDLNQQIYDLFDDYVHDRISRRGFFTNVGKYTTTGISVAAVFNFLSPRYVEAQQVSQDDPRLKNEILDSGLGLKDGIKDSDGNPM